MRMMLWQWIGGMTMVRGGKIKGVMVNATVTWDSESKLWKWIIMSDYTHTNSGVCPSARLAMLEVNRYMEE